MRADTRTGMLIAVAATISALLSAIPHIDSWNDGSRLATVEALVDHGTFAIDESIFHQEYPPGHRLSSYTQPALIPVKTQDKLLIDGHYYSDKTPVPAVLMAGEYWLIQRLTGLRASDDPATFSYAMAVLSSGISYVIACLCVFGMGRVAGLNLFMSVALTLSFAMGTLAWTYSRSVNGHIMQLAATAGVCLLVMKMAQQRLRGEVHFSRIAWAGFLTGLAYTLDVGVGPPLVATTACLMWYLRPGLRSVAVFGLAALPWLGLHHGINYAIAGTVTPANANVEYLTWPGSPFDTTNMTGQWNHDGIGSFLKYAGDMLFGRKGFVGHNLPIWVAVGGVFMLAYHYRELRPQLAFATVTCLGVWLIYAMFSNNWSGHCVSIRWFVPLLAPAYLVIAHFLARFPTLRWSFWVLTFWGVLVAASVWYRGPWRPGMGTWYWICQGSALISWLIGFMIWWRSRERNPSRVGSDPPKSVS